MVRHKNEFAPNGASHEFNPAAFMRCPDSPPSLSLTNSPDKRTDEKLANIVSARDLKMAGKDQLKVNFIFRCLSCNKAHNECFVPYEFDSNFGNCEACGGFQNLTSLRMIEKMGYQDTRCQSILPSQAIRKPDQHFKCEVPMDVILKRLTECQKLGRLYNPDAFYVESREIFVDWMCDLSDRLRVQPETFHHSVNIFDAYLQRADIK